MIKNKNILVAGGSGLVGVNLTKRLIGAGACVLPTYFSHRPEFLTECYRRFDFNRFEDCMEATRGMDYVIICASQTFGVKMMKDNPTVSILSNLRISSGLMEACNLNKVDKVMLISSGTVYQETSLPVKEEQLDLNIPPYKLYYGVGWLNRYLEHLAKFYQHVHNMKIGIIRPANVYGPYDKFDDDKSHVLPALIKRAVKKENPFIVWGDKSAVRDFVYVEDLIDDLLDVFDNYCNCEPLNVSGGKGIDVETAVKVILDICGHDVFPQYDLSRPSSIPYRVLDMERIEFLLGKRKRTPFEEGIAKTVEWYKATLGHF